MRARSQVIEPLADIAAFPRSISRRLSRPAQIPRRKFYYYFRQLILKTVLDAKLGSRTGDEEDAKLFQRVSAFLDEILIALVDVFP